MRIFLICILLLYMTATRADVLSLDNALRATYTACVGIDDELSDLKKMAGINTAITGVGTAAAGGATVVGLVKASKDKEAENIEIKLEELRKIEEQNPQPDPTDEELSAFMKEFAASREEATKEIEKYQAELDKLNKQSKKLGNWRTGLIASGTVTNVAGAIIAGGNKVDKDLKTQIESCRESVKALRSSIMQARIEGADVSEAEDIAKACGEYDYVDVSPINKRGKGAMISSIVGATTGAAGTVTSVMANTDSTRNDNTDDGKKKEKNLNTASNILAGATTAASATATVFNATQISAIKKVASVAEKCTEVLK